MITIHNDIEQGTDAWRAIRAGKPTASRFKDVMAEGKGFVREAYMNQLAAEIITGEPTESFKSAAMERGTAMEDSARDYYSFLHNAEPVQVGFVTNGRIGCSPDSLLGTTGILEIKTQRGDLLAGTLDKARRIGDKWFPPEHRAQTQGNLLVTEREFADLIIYWPKMPAFEKRAYRDEKYIQEMRTKLDIFLEELDELVDYLKRFGHREAA